MKSTIRTFIAVGIGDEIRRCAAQLIEQWRPLARGIKWVEPENLHITLKFLGDVASGRIAAICDAVTEATKQVPPFELIVCRAGAFPNIERPRTLWLGTGEGADELAELHRRIDLQLAELSFPVEGRPFKGHLTLGRVRRAGRSPALTEQMRKQAEFCAGSVWVSEVTVFSSRLTPNGPVYDPMAHIPLAGKLQ